VSIAFLKIENKGVYDEVYNRIIKFDVAEALFTMIVKFFA
jgi:hypothetical protein